MLQQSCHLPLVVVPKWKLFGVLSTSRLGGCKMRLPLRLCFWFPIVQCILSSVHQQALCILAMSVSEPQLQAWNLKDLLMVGCEGVCLVICRKSSNLLHYLVRKVSMSKCMGEARRGEVSIWENRDFFLSASHLIPCLTKAKSGEFLMEMVSQIIAGFMLLKLLPLDIWRGESGVTFLLVLLLLGLNWMHVVLSTYLDGWCWPVLCPAENCVLSCLEEGWICLRKDAW